MIKLVVSDVDGTLLPKGEKYVSDIILKTIEDFKRKDIIFAVASGRSYSELYNIMKQTDDIYYICCDGGCIIYNNEVVYERGIDRLSLKKFKDKENIFFHTPFETKEVYTDADNVVKISAFGGGYFEAPFGTYEVYRDKSWTEWIRNDCGKGQAVEYIQKNKNIKINETAAYGDNFNDTGMFRRAGVRYCMKKAPNQVKMLCNYITDDIEKSLSETGGK